MQLSTLKSLIDNPSELIKKVRALRPEDKEDFDIIQPENHEVMDESIRKKREIKYDSEIIDPNTGEKTLLTRWEEVTRLPSAVEKNIINWSVTMAAGVPVQPISKPKNETEEVMAAMVEHELEANKVDFKDKEVLRLLGTYKRVAEIWFSEECDADYWGDLGEFKYRMRLMLLSYETGDTLFPLFDDMRDFIGLTREYKIKDDEGKEYEMFDLFTVDQRFTYKQTGNDWAIEKDVKTKYGKLNVIYYEQDRTEYADIIQKRKRLETLQSDVSEQNLATGSPIIVTSKLLGMNPRGETGKILEVEDGGKVEILQATGAPEAIKLEWDNLKKDINFETSTPDMSIFEAQSMGANVPGVTIKLRFLPAILKALNKQSGEWGTGIQRRYNFLKSACAVINPDVSKAKGMVIKPKFGIYLPSNQTEEIANVVAMVNAGLISKKTGIAQIGIVENVDEEWEAIQEEAKAAQEAAAKIALSQAPPVKLTA